MFRYGYSLGPEFGVVGVEFRGRFETAGRSFTIVSGPPIEVLGILNIRDNSHVLCQ